METPLEHATLVRIGTGERRQFVIDQIERLWRPEHLRNDWQIPMNRYADGHLVYKNVDHAPSLDQWARIDEEREAQANNYRAEVKAARARLAEAETALAALYRRME